MPRIPSILKWLFLWPYLLPYHLLMLGLMHPTRGYWVRNRTTETHLQESPCDRLSELVPITAHNTIDATTNPVSLQKATMMQQTLVPTHSLLLVNVAKSISNGRKIYDSARYAWKLSPTRIHEVDYVLAHDGSRVVAVFKPLSWQPASDPIFATLPNFDSSSDRWGFVGEVAESEILALYFNKHLPEDFNKRGASNPVRFIEVVESGSLATELKKGGSSFSGTIRHYISAAGGVVTAIVVYDQIATQDGLEWRGAYYGYAGGGVNDGGYFRLRFEDSLFENFDFSALEDIQESEPQTFADLEKLMRHIWTLVSDDEEDLVLTDAGEHMFAPDSDGVWMDNEFDGDMLDEISEMWGISLRFTG